MDIYNGEAREVGTGKEREREERTGYKKKRETRTEERKGVRVREGSVWEEERSFFSEGKRKGLGKTPKQIRVVPLTDRKFVEVRPRDASRLSQVDRLRFIGR